MFTGIVQEISTISAIQDRDGLRTITLSLTPESFDGLKIGASVAVDGVCLTVSHLREERSVDFDIMLQSLKTTTLADIKIGSQVNVERAAKQGAEVGGHILSGHIDCCGKIIEIQKPPNNWMLRIEIGQEWRGYIFSKGYIAINGTSLTVSAVDKATGYFRLLSKLADGGAGHGASARRRGVYMEILDESSTEATLSCSSTVEFRKKSFDVWLIPETLRRTTFSEKRVGDLVNIEIERSTQILVDTVKAAMEEQLRLQLPTFIKAFEMV
jgi:riboflavin synthase